MYDDERPGGGTLTGSPMEPPTAAPLPRRKIPSWLPQAIGYAASAISLVFFFHGYSFQELFQSIRTLDFRWVTLAIVAYLASYIVQAWRWDMLLSPVVRTRFWRTVQSIYIGLFANEILPLHVGELIRCYLMAHWNDLRVSLGFASAAVERLIDGFWMLFAFAITAAIVRGIPHDVTIGVQILAAILIGGTIALCWIVLTKHEASTAIAESRSAATFRHIIEGLHLMGNRRTLGLTTLISLVYVVLQFFSVYFLMKGYGLDLSFWAGCGVLTIVRLATIVPNAPGNVGVFNVGCETALRLFDVETNDAKTFSIILLAIWTLPLLVTGGIATLLAGVNVTELRERARHSMGQQHAS